MAALPVEVEAGADPEAVVEGLEAAAEAGRRAVEAEDAPRIQFRRRRFDWRTAPRKRRRRIGSQEKAAWREKVKNTDLATGEKTTDDQSFIIQIVIRKGDTPPQLLPDEFKPKKPEAKKPPAKKT